MTTTTPPRRVDVTPGRWATAAPPRLGVSAIALATLTSVIALVALVAIGKMADQVLLIPPMAASMALVAGAPALPLSQPRNVVGGQVASALTGLGVGLVSHSVWASAVAGGLALGVMLLLRVPHSPAAATAIIGCLTAHSTGVFLVCVVIASVVLVLVGLASARLRRVAYPTYWW